MTQRKRIWWFALLGVAVAGGVWWWLHNEASPTAAGAHKDGAPWSMWPGQLPNAAPTMGAAPNPTVTAPDTTHVATSPLDTTAPPVCRATADGSLLIDQQTRNDVERLHALYQGQEAQQKLEACSAGLPPKAQRDLKDLFQNYAQYSQAVTQAFPPAQSTGTVDEAKQQLKGLKELRRQYFGAEGAKAMFGEEEAITQDLLNHIEANKDPKMSFDDKVSKAQEEVNKEAGAQP